MRRSSGSCPRRCGLPDQPEQRREKLSEGRIIVCRTSVTPAQLAGRARPAERRDKVSGQTSGPSRATRHPVQVGRLPLIQPIGTSLGLTDQPHKHRVDQGLMAQRLQRRELLGPRRTAAGRHQRRLVPGQHRKRAVQTREPCETVFKLAVGALALRSVGTQRVPSPSAALTPGLRR